MDRWQSDPGFLPSNHPDAVAVQQISFMSTCLLGGVLRWINAF